MYPMLTSRPPFTFWVPALLTCSFPKARLAALVSLLFQHLRTVFEHSLSDWSLLSMVNPGGDCLLRFLSMGHTSPLLWLGCHFYKCSATVEWITTKLALDAFFGHLVELPESSTCSFWWPSVTVSLCPSVPQWHITSQSQDRKITLPFVLYRPWTSLPPVWVPLELFLKNTIPFLFFYYLSFPWWICQNENEPIKISEERLSILSLT